MSKKLKKLQEVNDNIKKILIEMETRLFLENINDGREIITVYEKPIILKTKQ